MRYVLTALRAAQCGAGKPALSWGVQFVRASAEKASIARLRSRIFLLRLSRCSSSAPAPSSPDSLRGVRSASFPRKSADEIWGANSRPRAPNTVPPSRRPAKKPPPPPVFCGGGSSAPPRALKQTRRRGGPRTTQRRLGVVLARAGCASTRGVEQSRAIAMAKARVYLSGKILLRGRGAASCMFVVCGVSS